MTQEQIKAYNERMNKAVDTFTKACNDHLVPAMNELRVNTEKLFIAMSKALNKNS